MTKQSVVPPTEGRPRSPRRASGTQRRATLIVSSDDAERLRAEIQRQHIVLRRLMAGLRTECARSLALGDREPTASESSTRLGRLAALMREFHGTFERHLRYEEGELVPKLRDADAWGPLRVEQLREEHAAQRAATAALLADVRDGTKPLVELAEEVDWLVDGLLRDMIEEEAALLSPTALGEDVIVIDQCSG